MLKKEDFEKLNIMPENSMRNYVQPALSSDISSMANKDSIDNFVLNSNINNNEIK